MARRRHKASFFPSLLPDVLNPVHQIRVMERLIRRRAKKAGAPPGTLVHAGPPRVEEVRVHVFAYGPGWFREDSPSTPAEALPPPDAPGVTWIDVTGLHEVELIREVGERLSVHPLVLEDIVSVGQRPKLEEHGAYLYVVIPHLSVDGATGTVHNEQLSLLLGTNWVLTFQERPGDSFDPVRERIRHGGTQLRKHAADYLAYALVDAIVDHYFAVLEIVGDAAERVEMELVQQSDHGTMLRLHALKRELLVVRRAVWPVRDMLTALVRTDSPLVREPTRVFLRDVYDHSIRIIETVEVLRDVVGGMIDLYLSSVSNRTNEIMKALTIMASIFIPLTFIVGVYGMNFEHMPELAFRWAYPALLGFMALVAVGMLWSFRRRRWL